LYIQQGVLEKMHGMEELCACALLGIDLGETLAMQFKECKLLAMGNWPIAMADVM